MKIFQLVKTLLTLALITYSLNSSVAQSLFVKGGVNFANYKSTYAGKPQGTGGRLGLNVGLGFDYALDENFLLSTGAFISNRGGYDDNYEESLILNYLDVPILLKRYFKVEKYKLFAQAGPYIGLGINGRYEEDDSIYKIYSRNWTDDVSDHRLDAGLMLGGGIAFDKIEGSISLNPGLKNIWESDSDSQLLHRVFTIQLAYKIL